MSLNWCYVTQGSFILKRSPMNLCLKLEFYILKKKCYFFLFLLYLWQKPNFIIIYDNSNNTIHLDQFLVFSKGWCLWLLLWSVRNWPQLLFKVEGGRSPFKITFALKYYYSMYFANTVQSISNYFCWFYLHWLLFSVVSYYKCLACCLSATGCLKSLFRWSCKDSLPGCTRVTQPITHSDPVKIKGL